MCRIPAPSALCLGQEYPQCKARLTLTESRRSLLRRLESEVRARAISWLVSSADGASWGPETAREEEWERPGSEEALLGPPLWPLSGQAASASASRLEGGKVS